MVNPRSTTLVAALAALSLQLTACEAVKGVFKAGFWVGVLAVVAMAVLVFLGLNMFRRSG